MSRPPGFPGPETFEANARAALADGELHGALRRATDLFGQKRAAAVADVPDWEDLRDRARAIKDETLAELDRHLEAFVERAEAAGAVVHWARDGAEACETVLSIARASGATRIVKAKSMTTEEIDLNEFLLGAGCDPVETDLGEWIVQLAGEPPSHILAPAIHKTRGQIGELFARELAIEPTDDVQELTAVARRVLRRYFAESELGISGVNFAVAETGTILIIENEGNIRLSTSLPRVHVAVMGIEKVVPRFRDLEVFLRLLPRSGSGQRLTSYQSFLTGPGAPDGEGPEELHVVLLDNGRSRMLKERVTRQSLACIRCGACLNACPVYREIGGHAYGTTYCGPIGAVITPQLAGAEKASKLPFASSLCGACREVCPVKIDIPELLLDMRARLVSRTGLPSTPGAEHPLPARRLERLGFRLWAWAMTSPARYAWLGRIGRRVANAPFADRLFPPRAAWTAQREAPPTPPKSFRELWREERSG